MVQVDVETVQEVYNKIRNTSEITWAAFGYSDDNNITVIGQGSSYDEFKELCNHDTRCYGYASFTTGDEMSKRKKFAFVTWIGDKVGAIKKAQVSIHKAEIKRVIQSAAVDVQTSTKEDISERNITELLKKAGGASYGTG